MRALIPRDEIQVRLPLIFPREAFDPVLSNPLAGAALAAMLYVDAVVPDAGDVPTTAVWARPSLCLWMSEDAYSQAAQEQRASWREAALSHDGRRAIEQLQTGWGFPHASSWYRDNTRETLRDETFPAWLDHGALRDRPGLPTTSGKPRWALTAGFADLFDPGLTGDALLTAIEEWRSARMSPGDRFRISTLRERERAGHAVDVSLPDGTHRSLEPGLASLILRGVIEAWAPSRLRDPVVLSISEPGDKVYLADAARLRALGLTIDAGNLLPDALIVDIGKTPPQFWIVEAVASDGPVTEDRKRQLLRWAEGQHIPPASCRFLSAFLDRNDAAARRRLKDLAIGTLAWFASEPTRELAWYDIEGRDEESGENSSR